MRKTFTVKEVPGSKRQSDHIYTHAIIGEYDFDLALSIIEKHKVENERFYKKDFAYYELCGNGIVGVTVYSKSSGYKIDQMQKDKGLAIIEKYGNADNYANYKYKSQIDSLNLTRSKREGELVVLQWSRSAENAS